MNLKITKDDALNQAFNLHQQGEFSKAGVLYQMVLSKDPENFDALHLLGLLAYQNNDPSTAVKLIGKAVLVTKGNSQAYSNLALAYEALGNYENAKINIRKAISIDQNNAEYHFRLGSILIELESNKDALNEFNKVTNIEPKFYQAWINKGLVLLELKQPLEALACINSAIQINAESPEAHFIKGNALHELKRLDEALINYEIALNINNKFEYAYCNKGITLFDLGRVEEAVQNFIKAIKIDPEFTDAFYNLGNSYGYLRKYIEAIEAYDKALKIKPNFAEALANRANTLFNLNRLQEALLNYDAAIAHKVDYEDAYNNRGNTLKDLRIFDKAIIDFEAVEKLNPQYKNLSGMLLHTKMLICDWDDFEIRKKNLIESINIGLIASPCFAVLAITDTPSVQLKAAKNFMKESRKKIKNSNILIPQRKSKIHIAYYSGDFREHPVSYLTAQLFELHNKERFELSAFYYGPADTSDMRKRIEAAFENFFDVSSKSDEEIAELSRNIGVDIAIDLSGMTAYARNEIFLSRAAPIQLHYCGYLGTMGADYYDYLIADSVLIPAEKQKFYTEKIIYLSSYQVNDGNRPISEELIKKNIFGLPENKFIFCCMNDNYKITPVTFDSWARIMLAVPESVLYLYSSNKWAKENLNKEIFKRGVDPSRLIFSDRVNRDIYLARYKLFDLFLDTFIYNAGTTASDALWAGLPVITCAGESFASRIAASVLSAIGLQELITETQEDYEKAAIELALNPLKLEAIKEKLKRNKSTTNLFNTQKFTQEIEDAFMNIYDRYITGQQPSNVIMNN